VVFNDGQEQELKKKSAMIFSKLACLHGIFAATLPYFGSPQLLNALLQRAHFWVSCSIALCLQYAQVP
jgi:hypothetical protein